MILQLYLCWNRFGQQTINHLSLNPGDRILPRKVAAKLIEHEQTWLPLIAEQLSLPVPTPYRLGKPALGYPWRWTVLPWLTVMTADQAEPHPNHTQCFGSFLKSLHIPAPSNAPINPVRGITLSQ